MLPRGLSGGSIDSKLKFSAAHIIGEHVAHISLGYLFKSDFIVKSLQNFKICNLIQPKCNYSGVFLDKSQRCYVCMFYVLCM